MSGRQDHRRRDASRDHNDNMKDKDRDRYRDRAGRGDGRRSRSPPRRNERDRRREGRDYGRDRIDDRRDRGHRDDRRRDDRHDLPWRDGERDRDRDRPAGGRDEVRPRRERTEEKDSKNPVLKPDHPSRSETPAESLPKMVVDPSDPMPEDGEAMDATNDDDDAALMAMMGVSGFGTTKGKRVEGNQEGSVEVKKIRTWRQYMNRRGGFNRPLDKIK